MKALKLFALSLALVGASTVSAQTKLVVGDMNDDGRLSIEDVTRLTETILERTPSRIHSCNNGVRTYAGHDYVDLALPSGTLWATCNVGAAVPEEYGDYFAWGEITSKSEYTMVNYKYANGTNTSFTKYCTDSKRGTVDNKTVLELADDAAYANWGDAWRMPSLKQLNELYDEKYVTKEWACHNGVYGCEITSKNNGNQIFIPAAGLKSAVPRYVGVTGNLWSRDLGAVSTEAYLLNAAGFEYTISDEGRPFGRSVRPVLANNPTQTITLSTAAIYLDEEENMQLSASSYPTIDNTRLIWTSSNPEVAVVSNTGEVTAKTSGVATVSVESNDGSGTKATCTVVVYPHHDYVDLGLPSGTLWATCNVGANAPEEYGDYFQWARNAVSTNYDWSSYPFCEGTENSMTRYCTNAQYGTVDNLTEVYMQDDAASVNWGNIWKTPSREQIEELVNPEYTTSSYITQKGVVGRLFTSKKNGNSIFLPYAGAKVANKDISVQIEGLYWSRNLYPENDHAYVVNISSTEIKTGKGLRYRGRTVRAVREKR